VFGCVGLVVGCFWGGGGVDLGFYVCEFFVFSFLFWGGVGGTGVWWEGRLFFCWGRVCFLIFWGGGGGGVERGVWGGFGSPNPRPWFLCFPLFSSAFSEKNF